MVNDGAVTPYVPRRLSHTIRRDVRGIDYCVRLWGRSDDPPLVLLHGARDQAATFQFLVDAFGGDYRIVAPDWRGHGGSAWTPGGYWLADFLGDLDVLLDDLLPGVPLPVIGHSMGGNVAALFAALRPDRVSRLVLLDALGNPLSRSPVDMPVELTAMLDAQRTRTMPRRHDGIAAMAERLRRANVRLDPARAMFLANAAARAMDGGGFVWSHDPRFRTSLPTLHGVEEWGTCWRRIAAPVLALLASDPRAGAATTRNEDVRARAAFFHDIRARRIPYTGHNLHHDAAAILASLIEAFVDAPATVCSLLDRFPPA